MIDVSPVKNRKTIEEGASRTRSIFLACSTAGNMVFEQFVLIREIVENSNTNQATITATVPAAVYQSIAAPPTRYVLAKKGNVSKPKATAAVNQNFTHSVMPKICFSFIIRLLTTRKAWMRKTIMNINGPGRFQAVINQPHFSVPVGNSGNLAKTVKINEAKKHTISTTDARCPALITNLNLLIGFNVPP